MEKPTSLCSEHNAATSATISPPPSPLQDLTTDFSSMYNFIFSPKSTLPQSLSVTPSSCSSSDDLKLVSNDDVATATIEHRLNQARLVLECQQMCDHFDRCFSRLQALEGEIETLRRENNELRVANIELIKLVSLSRAPKKSLTKSASFGSSNYLKINLQQRVVNPPSPLHVPSMASKEEKAIEMDVYNQGMVKTEICNKWQETGICPYGDHCQFAHGIVELRPIIRHPRYKTQVCRMVLAGEACPYGHRCHFRHSLTETERLLISP